jgi:hypothetical protein
VSKLADQLRAARIYNDHDMLSRFADKGRDVCVSYRAGDRWHYSKSSVYSPSHHTGGDEHWQNHGKKSFSGMRLQSLPLALEWASKKYGIDEWVPSPFGGYIPAEVLKRAKKFVASQPKALDI